MVLPSQHKDSSVFRAEKRESRELANTEYHTEQLWRGQEPLAPKPSNCEADPPWLSSITTQDPVALLLLRCWKLDKSIWGFYIWHLSFNRNFPAGSMVKNLPPSAKTWVQSLGWEWKPTPVFLPGKIHGQRRLAGCSPWSHKRVRHNLVTKQQQQERRRHSPLMEPSVRKGQQILRTNGEDVNPYTDSWNGWGPWKTQTSVHLECSSTQSGCPDIYFFSSSQVSQLVPLVPTWYSVTPDSSANMAFQWGRHGDPTSTMQCSATWQSQLWSSLVSAKHRASTYSSWSDRSQVKLSFYMNRLLILLTM